jgi:hypothetical protein
LQVVKVRALAVAVFRSLAPSPRAVADVIAEVSMGSPEGALVEREKFDQAVTLVVRTGFVEAEGDTLRLTPDGEQFWRRVSHLEASGMKKWIRDAVGVYSRGSDLQHETSDAAWDDGRLVFLECHRQQIAARLEVLDGLLGAIDNWHFVSTLISSAGDRSAAIAALQGSPYQFSKTQAREIIEMRMSQRTALGRLSLSEERDAIRAELKDLEEPEPVMDGSAPAEITVDLREIRVVDVERLPSRSRIAG